MHMTLVDLSNGLLVRVGRSSDVGAGFVAKDAQRVDVDAEESSRTEQQEILVEDQRGDPDQSVEQQ